MGPFTRELRRRLREAGFVFEREAKGDHEIWSHPDGRRVTIDIGTRSRHTANKILKDAGLPKAF
ncbi:MAG TPA: type II toxin-antitoxin system HicA family toxin [Stellaceae bacterium]|nr:type II toxin-antitoxin system HicA family toxin [Stellaceae bacterium]